MKKLILIAILALSFSSSFAGKIKIKSLVLVGSWKNDAIWDAGRTPEAGDTVTIPYGTLVIIDDVQNIGGDLHLKIYGTLKFVGGKISMGDSSKIDIYATGLIMKQGSASETIRIGNELKFGKDDVAIIGPATANILTPESPLAFLKTPGLETMLAIKLSGFNASRKNDDVTINWSATNETDANLYDLQRSFDGSTWKSIAYITPIGNSTTANNYTYADQKVTAKTVYYRLKQVDNSGKFVYSQVKFINTLKENEIKIAAMAQNKVLIQFSEEVKGAVNVYLTSLSGQVVTQKAVNNPQGQLVLDAPVLAKGSYVVTISDNQSINFSKQVIF